MRKSEYEDQKYTGEPLIPEADSGRVPGFAAPGDNQGKLKREDRF
jgi:hypothetical protein